MGGRAGQYALRRRSRAHVRNRSVRRALVEDGNAPGPEGGDGSDGLAPRCRPGADGGEAEGRPRPHDPGGLRRAQRNLDRRHQPHRGDPRGHRRGGPSGPVHGRHGFLACLDGLPPRRMGRGRHRRRLAEGPDAAAGAVLQLRGREGARRVEVRDVAQVLLGLGGHARIEQERFFPLHAGDQPALRPARGTAHAAGRRPAERVCAPRAPCGGDAPRGARLGTGDRVRRSCRIQQLAHRGHDAAGA